MRDIMAEFYFNLTTLMLQLFFMNIYTLPMYKDYTNKITKLTYMVKFVL